MKRVTGIGGIYFKAKGAPELQAQYKRYAGVNVRERHGIWADPDGKPTGALTRKPLGGAR